MLVPTKYILRYWNMLGEDYKQIILSWTPEGTFRGNFINQYSSILTNIKPVIKTKNVWNNCQMSGLGWFFKESNYNHPGYTSEDITKRVITSFSIKGQTILDNFMGTGTTAIICIRENRNYIGFELNPKDIIIQNKRIEQERMQLKLDL